MTSKLFIFQLLSYMISIFHVKAQGVLPSGDPYFCVPPGICPDSGGIDPRIITPNETDNGVENGDLQHLIDEVFFDKILIGGGPTPGAITCPAGRVPCFAQGAMSNCGTRLVPITNTADGDAQFGAYPWQAYLQGPSGFIGSGSLLSPYHVLTAAHKVLAFESNPSQLTVILGVNDPATINGNPPAPRSAAAQISIYNRASYNNATLKNDLAVVRLANPISLVGQNSINTLCLPPSTATATTYSSPVQRCVVSGWGQIQPNNPAVPTKLKQVAVDTTDINTCANGFAGRVNTALYLDMTGGQVCAGGQAQKDACFQDGGAPLTCGAGTAASRFTAAGVVIWGKSCGQPGVYGVYTNVPFPSYRQWIVQTITQPIP